MSRRTFDLKRKLANYLPRIPGDALKLTVVLAILFPFYWMISTAFKTYSEAILTPPTLWPENFTLNNFIGISRMKVNLWRYAINTFAVTGAVIVLQLLVMIPAAYAFAKREFPLKSLFFGIVLVAFMIPGQITYITTYLLMARMKLLQTLWPQILPFGANAFGIFMLRQSFKQAPDELIESARLDSASEIKIMLRVVLPMCRPAMVTIALFSFISHWNSYFWPLVMTNNENVRPLTMLIEKVRDAESGINWNTIMAANFILVVPVLIVFMFASDKIIQGLTYRGVK
jgi:sn-glycerol 3-phosphate transport system permease protein